MFANNATFHAAPAQEAQIAPALAAIRVSFCIPPQIYALNNAQKDFMEIKQQSHVNRAIPLVQFVLDQAPSNVKDALLITF